MSSSANKRPSPVSIRFSEAERAWLEARAGGEPLSAFIKSSLFGDVSPRRISTTQAKADREALARLLAWLGQTQLAAHLAVLANAAESGSLDVSEPVTKAVLRACADIEEMRNVLMHALGKEAPPAETLRGLGDLLACHSFLTAAERARGER